VTTPEADHEGVATTHTARWVAVAILVIAAGLIAVLATRPPALTVEAQNPLVNHPAPTVEGVTLDGTHFQLPRAPGHYVVINFFASWCTPCQQEAPDLSRFYYQQKNSADGAAMVSVVFHDTTSTAVSFLQHNDDLWPAVSDPGGNIAQRYGVTAPPTTFIVDPAGRVTAVLEGPSTQQNLDTFLKAARAQQAGANA
jgi:cytochrome c biogenesis protein CcmG/thiol:disulfide interchange protein DsbE